MKTLNPFYRFGMAAILMMALSLMLAACGGGGGGGGGGNDCSLTQADCQPGEVLENPNSANCACVASGCQLTQADCQPGEVLENPTSADCACVPSGCPTSDLEAFVTETSCAGSINPVGDVSCNPADLEPTPTGGTVTLSGSVLDFQSDAPVGGALMVVDGLGIQATTAPDGTYQLAGLPGSSRINIKITAATYRETWQYQVLTPVEDGTDGFVAISEATYNLVPALWGVSPKATDCVIAGSVTDCVGNELEGFGITAHSQSCEPSAGIKWFVDRFPNATQCPASADGLYGAVNLPTPDVTIEVIGAGGARLAVMGPVPCVAGAIGVLNIDFNPLD